MKILEKWSTENNHLKFKKFHPKLLTADIVDEYTIGNNEYWFLNSYFKILLIILRSPNNETFLMRHLNTTGKTAIINKFLTTENIFLKWRSKTTFWFGEKYPKTVMHQIIMPKTVGVDKFPLFRLWLSP